MPAIRARPLFAAAAVLATAAFAGPHAHAPAKYALLVGIGDYVNYGDEEGGDLRAAADDARSMRDVLVARWGFESGNVRLLTDTDATRDAIRAGLTEWLPSVAKPGDLVVFYFSGHGSQAFDEDGDEADGLDETLCPTDVLRNNASRDIKDDELARWLEGLPTENVTVILDSCHSGTATRAAAPFARRKALNREGAGDDPPHAAAGVSATTADDLRRTPVLEISAAQAHQYALETVWEENGVQRVGGAFTVPLVRYLWQVPGGTSYREVFRLTREEMRRASFEQEPQISTVPAVERAAFAAGGAGAEASVGAARTATVTGGEGGRVWLDGGAAAGVGEGDLYRAGDALLRVVQVHPDRAAAEVARGSAPAAGTRATLAAAALSWPDLRVSVGTLEADARAALQRALGDGGVVLQAGPAAPAHLVVRPEGGDWVVASADGAERQRVRAGDEAALAAALAREQAALSLASLENPAYPFALDFSFAGGKNAFRVGETVTFRARAARAGWLTVVDLDPAGKVTVIFPNRFDAENRVETGEEVVLPTSAMPFVFRMQEPAGRGVVRAFVTERPLRLDFATGGRAEIGKLAAALREAAGTPETAADARAVPVGSWATAYVVYDVVRP